MVSWTDLQRVIQSNTDRNACVALFSIPLRVGAVERFPIHMPADAAPSNESPVAASSSSPSPSPSQSKPAVSVSVPVVAAAAATAATVAVSVPVRSERALKTLTKEIDPIVLGIEERDVLYTCAMQNSRRAMECEEAQRIEALVAETYTSQGGRCRGWTKTGLDTYVKARCASGGDIRELDKAKKAFPWQLIVEEKPVSAFLDFLCVAKQIRVAVWFDDIKQVILYPAADHTSRCDDTQDIPLYHVTSAGQPRLGLNTCKHLLEYCDANKYVLLPPTSVIHSLSNLTLAELESVSGKLGMPTITGTKAERVAKIAIYKLRQRLGVPVAKDKDKTEVVMKS